jgi:hypothetical protein
MVSIRVDGQGNAHHHIMFLIMLRRWCIFLLIASAGFARDRIAFIEFYGSKGIDTEAVRRALPFHEGDPYVPYQTKRQAGETVRQVTGHDATEVAVLCCVGDGDQTLFIGLPGESSRKFTYNPEPKGAVRISEELLTLQKRLDAAGEAATKKGGDAAGEDDSTGYSLAHDPDMRALQLTLRAYALRHEAELYRVVGSSSDALDREYAADALGYARQSRRQIAALVRASRDASDDVRNDATRALGVLLESNVALARWIPPQGFIDMMSSGIWTDRNKASFVLEPMTRGRYSKLLAALRAQALEPLIEMARWRDTGHALTARQILARIAGVPEARVNEIAVGPIQALLDLLPAR